MKLVNLIPLKEIDFPTQDAFDAYNKQHKLRPDTKVTVAGKKTTAAQAAQNSAPVKGTSVFSGDSGNTGSDNDSKKFDDNIKKVTNRDKKINDLENQADDLRKKSVDTDREVQQKYPNWASKDPEYQKKRAELEAISNRYNFQLRDIRKNIDKMKPSVMKFGNNTQKDVTDWFKKNNVPYELKHDGKSIFKDLQFDWENFPKDKVKEFKDLAKKVRDKEGIYKAGENDFNSVFFINN